MTQVRRSQGADRYDAAPHHHGERLFTTGRAAGDATLSMTEPFPPHPAPRPPGDLSVVVIGAGPAGLTAAYMLAKAGRAAGVTILESDDCRRRDQPHGGA